MSKLVSIVDQMMKDGRTLNEIQSVIEEMSSQENRIEEKKAQDLQATDALAESTPSDTESASENTLPESQYVSDVADPTPLAPEFTLDKDVNQMIRSYDLSEQETQDIIDQVDEEYVNTVKEFELLDKDIESAEEASNQKIGTRSKHDAQYLPSPTGGGGIWVWPDGYQETDFGFTIPDLNTGEEISTDTQTTTDLKKDQYLSNTAKDLKPLFEQARRNLKNGDTLAYNDTALVEEVKKLRKQQLEQNYMDSKIEDQMELLSDTEAQLKYGPGQFQV